MQKKKRLPKIVIVLCVILVLSGALFGLFRFLKVHYTVKTVAVDGSVHYTDDEIKDIVMSGRFGDNSLYLAYKYKNREITDIPFVETISVKIVSNDTIRISVYEKSLAGYVEYLGRYIYFDKDGVVVESSSVRTNGVPEVVGLDFDYVVLYEPLPVEDPQIFSNVLNITKLMTKYGVEAEKMYFKDNGELVLYHGDVTINLGKEDDMDIKMMNLPSLLDNLKGMSGTLRMENYDESTRKVSFEPDKSDISGEE